MPPHRSTLSISVTQRLALRAHARSYPNLSQAQLREWFQREFQRLITQPTVSESLSSRFNHLEERLPNQPFLPTDRKRIRTPLYPELEQALYEWHQRLEKEVPLSEAAIRTQAVRFWKRLAPYQGMEVPQFSNGWLMGFKKRHSIHSRVRHGEASSVDEAAIAEQLHAVQAIVKQFNPCDVYNCDETGLFWKSTPDRGLSTQSLSGTKQHKARLTAHFCCNADGSHKLPLWFIGKAARPRCFNAAKVNISALDCIYTSNSAAWMTAAIMEPWLHWFSRKVHNKRILLLMDNFSAHTLAIEIIKQQDQLQNLVICWLPPNSTSKTQPLDQGIIQSFKAQYRKRWLTYMLDEFESQRNPLHTMNILKAIRWSIQAWDNVTPEAIINCWYHSTVIEKPQQLPVAPAPPVDEVSVLITRLSEQKRITTAMAINNFLNPTEEAVTDTPEDLTELISKQYDTVDDKESDEEIEILPKVTVQQALTAIKTIRLFEEQKEDGKATMIRMLDTYEAQLVEKRLAGQKQTCIASFLA